jgi:hypothetical protein
MWWMKTLKMVEQKPKQWNYCWTGRFGYFVFSLNELLLLAYFKFKNQKYCDFLLAIEIRYPQLTLGIQIQIPIPIQKSNSNLEYCKITIYCVIVLFIYNNNINILCNILCQNILLNIPRRHINYCEE